MKIRLKIYQRKIYLVSSGFFLSSVSRMVLIIIIKHSIFISRPHLWTSLKNIIRVNFDMLTLKTEREIYFERTQNITRIKNKNLERKRKTNYFFLVILWKDFVWEVFDVRTKLLELILIVINK